MTGAAGTKVVVALPLAPPLLAQLADFHVTHLPGGRSDERAFLEALADAEGLLVSSNVAVDRAVLDAAPRLRVISTMSVGVDHIDLAAAGAIGAMVTITPVLSDAVADVVMALVTMLARRIPAGMAAVAAGRWHGVPLGNDLARRVLLLVGFGRIGQAVAVRARAAGMEVRYVDPAPDRPDLPGVTRVGSLEEGLPEADVVSLHVDLHAGTHHLMGRREFALMKPSAHLVNTARGGVVDQDALLGALARGELAGAGLDVLRDEPPRAGDPILSAPNLIILPHIGSATTETRGAMAQCAVDNLVMGLRGEGIPPLP